MHNTHVGAGHFHTYLLLGEVAMAFGFMAWLVRGKTASGSRMSGSGPLCGFLAYISGFGAAGFVLVFLISGAISIPRRWAVHYEEWVLQDRHRHGSLPCWWFWDDWSSSPDSWPAAWARAQNADAGASMAVAALQCAAVVIGAASACTQATDGFRALTEEGARRLHVAAGAASRCRSYDAGGP